MHDEKKRPDWTDVRFFLEVARAGTISAAGERLGVEHSTVSRRIDRLEESLGTVLFDRRRNGYSLTDEGHALIAYAESMENALLGAVEENASKGGQVHGTVRVGTPEAFGILVLASSLVELSAQQPGIHVELMAQPQFPSLVTREVEILVTLEPPQVGRYTVTRLAEIDYYLYGSQSYLDAHPPVRSLSDVGHHTFVDYIHDGSVSDRYRVLEETATRPVRRFTTNSVLAQREAAARGMGLVLLTPYVAESEPKLICLSADRPLIKRTIWLAAPEDLFRLKRIRIVWDFVRSVVSGRPEHFRS